MNVNISATFHDDDVAEVLTPGRKISEFNLRKSGLELVIKNGEKEDKYNFTLSYRIYLSDINTWSRQALSEDDVVIVKEDTWDTVNHNDDEFFQIFSFLQQFYTHYFNTEAVDAAYLSRLAMKKDELRLELKRLEADEKSFRERK